MKNYRNKEVKLENVLTGLTVKVGDKVTSFRGEVEVVRFIKPPHKASSSGFVNNFYAGVYNCKFVEIEK